MTRLRAGVPAGPPAAAGARSGTTRRTPLSYWKQYLAISPFFVIFAVFFFGPVLFSLFLAFQRWDGLGEIQFVGLDQFRYLMKDPTFWLSMKNTIIIWVLSTIPMVFLSLVLAAMLHSSVRLVSFYRLAFFIPNVTSLVAIAICFFSIFSKFGLVNAALDAVHLPQVDWLVNPWAIKIVIALMMTWQWAGYNAIIFMAGLQAISTDVYEAAKIDGAGPIKTFFSITLPLLRPIILFVLIVSTVTGMQSFTEPQVLFGSNAATNPDSGGPGQAGLTVILYFYRTAFDNHDYGYGAAIAWTAFLFISIFALINWRLVARDEN